MKAIILNIGKKSTNLDNYQSIIADISEQCGIILITLSISLEQLSLYDCGLKNTRIKEKSFPKLSKLSLSNNTIALVCIKKQW